MAEQAKILIVDDDPDITEAMSLVLEGAGYQVVSASSAEEGMGKVETEHPDAIVLDVMMPDGTEGFHLVWQLRQHSDRGIAETPILMVTAIHDKTKLRIYPDQSDGTYQAGEFLPVQGFIDKPATPENLLKQVKAILSY